MFNLNWKKGLAVSLSAILVSAALVACGNQKSASQSQAPAPAGNAGTTQAAGAEKKEGDAGSQEASSEPVKLTMWAMSDDEACYQAVIEEYQKDHPNVEIEMVLYSSSEIAGALTTALAGRDDIDLFVTNGGQYLAAMIGAGMAENLDEYIKASGFDTSIFGSDYENALYNDGSAYGLPYRNSVSLLIYNKDFFDEKGVEYPNADTTWDELNEIAEKMTWGEGADKVYGFYNADRNTDWMGPATTNGTTFLSDDLSLIQKAMEIKVDACERGAMLSNAAYKAAGIGVRNMFTSGKSSMYVGGDWTIRQLRGDKENGSFTYNWDVAPMPTLGEGYAKDTCMGQYVYISVCSYSEKKQAAYDFLQFLCGEPGGMIFAEMGTLPAIRTEAAKTAFCGDSSQAPASIATYFDTNTVQGAPVRNGMSELDTFVKAEADLVFNGEQTAEEAVKKLYEEQKKYK